MQCDLLCLDTRTCHLAFACTPVRRRALRYELDVEPAVVEGAPTGRVALAPVESPFVGCRTVYCLLLTPSAQPRPFPPAPVPSPCCNLFPPSAVIASPSLRRCQTHQCKLWPGLGGRCVHTSLLPMVNPQPSYGAASGSDGGEAGPGGAGPLRVGEENHAQAGEFLSDCVLGMSDGLTVPYVDGLSCVLLSFSPGDALFFMTLPRSLFRPFCPGVCSPDSHLFWQSLPSPFIVLCSALSPPLRRLFFPPFVCGQLCPRCRPHLSRIIFIRDCPCRR